MATSDSYFVRVHRLDSSGRVTIENRDGALFPLSDDFEAAELEVGDVLRFEGDLMEVVDPDNWVESSKIGVICAIHNSVIAAEVESRIVAVSNDLNLPISVGNTVRLDARNGVTDVVQETPLRPEPISVARDDDDFDPRSLIEAPVSEDYGWDRFGGFPEIVDRAKTLVSVYFDKRTQFTALGVTPVRGALFSGPSGTGKTFLAKIIAHAADATLYVVTAAKLGGHLVGESESRLESIYKHAATQHMSIVFIDEIDSITRSRGNDGGTHSSRLVQTFLTALDGFTALDNVITIGTTNRIEDLDGALRRHGRFGFEILFRNPDEIDRRQILLAQLTGKSVVSDPPLGIIAEQTRGWSAADLNGMWTRAAELTVLTDRTVIGSDHLMMGMEAVAQDRAQRMKDAP